MKEINNLEELLEETEIPVAELLDKVDVGIVIVDKNYQILATNQKYLKIQGRNSGSIISNSCYSVSFGQKEPCPLERCAVQQSFQDGENHSTKKILNKNTENEIILEVQSFPLKDRETGEIKSVMEIVYDKTREYENNVLRDRFMMVMSHEARSPLKTIIGIVNFFQYKNLKELEKSKIEDLLMTIKNKANQVILNSETILQFNKFLSGSLELHICSVNIYSDIIEPVLEDYKDILETNEIIATADIDKSLKINSDFNLLKMIYANLLDNAAKYAKEKTRIYLTHAEDSAYNYFSTISCAEHIKNREKIFEKFASEGEKGIGFGLSFCRSIVEAHNGRMWIEPAYYYEGEFYSAEQRGILQPYPGKKNEKLIEANNFVFSLPKN